MLRRPNIKLPRDEKITSALVASVGMLYRAGKGPDETLGELFRQVQTDRVYGDGKTFSDLVPRGRTKAILREYQLSKDDPNFDLHEFVNRHFYEFSPHKQHSFHTDPSATVSEHIASLWKVLERRNRITRGSLLALPYPYIVPGGRFSEQFYWDSYFIMLGLAAQGHWSMIEGMMKNYAFMIRKFGYIPTANRSYFLSRSQPPFFSHMVRLLAEHGGETRTYAEYLPYLVAEYRFWMKGRSKLAKVEHRAYARLVEMPDGSLLNRYFDNKTTPRPESLREDIETASTAADHDPERLFLDLRAAAESGWDFSSRWLRDNHRLQTIHTTDIIPVDLNCLLYDLESLIAETYRRLKNPLLARKFQRLADRRSAAIMKYCWDEQLGTFTDFDIQLQQSTAKATLAMVFPLYSGIATQQQADQVAAILKRYFLKPGGLVTTLVDNGQQWDAPNGWAPLQWVAIQGLRRYGHHDLAAEIKRRWVSVNLKIFQSEHKLIEKYNVQNTQELGGGGEYPLQDGFGWTNGVLAALLNE